MNQGSNEARDLLAPGSTVRFTLIGVVLDSFGLEIELRRVRAVLPDPLLLGHYVEHYPPDTTALIYWLKNRRPDRWRDVQNIEAKMGHYVISERPMTEEEWIEHTSNGKQLDLEAKAIEHDANERKSNS